MLVVDRRALAEVRARGATRTRWPPRSSATACTTRCSTTRSWRPGTQYAARAWPTLVRGRPRGLRRRAACRRGARARRSTRWSTSWSREHEAKGTLHRGDGPYVAPPSRPTALRFPGKALALPGGTLLVADSGHHQLVELAADGETVRAPDRLRRARAAPTAPPTRRVQRAAGAAACCRPTSRRGRLRRRGRRHRQPPAARRATSPTARSRRSPAPARQWMHGGSPTAAAPAGRPVLARGTWPGTTAGSSSRWPASTSSGRSTRRPATAGVCAGTTQRGPARRPAGRGLVRPAVRAGGPPTATRLWIADSETSALRRRAGDGVGATPPSGRACSTSATCDGPAGAGAAAAPARRHARCRTARSRSRDTYNGAVRRLRPRDRTR